VTSFTLSRCIAMSQRRTAGSLCLDLPAEEGTKEYSAAFEREGNASRTGSQGLYDTKEAGQTRQTGISQLTFAPNIGAS